MLPCPRLCEQRQLKGPGNPLCDLSQDKTRQDKIFKIFKHIASTSYERSANMTHHTKAAEEVAPRRRLVSLASSTKKILHTVEERERALDRGTPC